MNKWLIIIEVLIILGIVIYFEAAIKRFRHQNKDIAEKYKELEQIHINLRKETEIKFLSTIEAISTA
jgi:hypothetical protein